MKVFISWSGQLSQRIGETIKEWLPAVLQSVKPYFTPSDIEKGSRWSAEISKELENSKVGIFIFTRDNLDSQWMIFEAGAISKTIETAKVCPILFGFDNSDFKGPLTQFQTSQFNKTDFKKLVRTINTGLGESKLEEKVLDEVYEMWWPKLEQKIGKLLEDNKVESTSLRDDRELLEEILALSRLVAKNSLIKPKSRPSKGYDVDKFESLVNEFLSSTKMLFDADWQYSLSCLSDESIGYFISPDGTFLNPDTGDDEGNNWGNRGGYLKSYRELHSFMEENELYKPNPFFEF